MSESDGNRAPARPRQVTIAGVMATTACLLLVFTLFDAMAHVRSADMRASIDDFLRTPPGDGLDLDASGVVAMLRGAVLFSGALAAAGVVLSVFALQRHRGARVGLSVAAVLLLFSATFVAGFLPVVIAVAAAMMWGREARDWFDGRGPRPVTESSGRTDGDASARTSRVGMAAWQPPSENGPRESAPPPTTYPFGVAPDPGRATPQPFGGPGGYASRPMSGRPTPVTVAVWLTWGLGGLVAGMFLLVVLTLLLQRDQLLTEMQKNAAISELGVSSQQILGFLWVFSAVSIFWALSAMALAVLAFRRVNVARIALVVSAGLAGVVSLFVVPFGWLHAVGAFTAMALLLRRSSTQWYAGDDRPYAGPPPPRPPQPQGPPDRPSASGGKPPVW